jgi:hypothetical protein
MKEEMLIIYKYKSPGNNTKNLRDVTRASQCAICARSLFIQYCRKISVKFFIVNLTLDTCLKAELDRIRDFRHDRQLSIDVVGHRYTVKKG